MIELRNAWKAFGKNHPGLAYGNLVFQSGEIVGLLGENGAGKTTLLKIIMGLIPLHEGEVLIDGAPIGGQYADVAFITEEGSFIPSMTPLEYGEFLADFFPRFELEDYLRLTDFFLLPRNQPIRTFSRGQKSKLEISAGFSKRASCLLLDEPLLGHDIMAKGDVLKLLLSRLEGHETVIIATHHIDEIEHLIDRALILKQGKIAADVRMEELQTEGRELAHLIKVISGYDEERYKQLFPQG